MAVFGALSGYCQIFLVFPILYGVYVYVEYGGHASFSHLKSDPSLLAPALLLWWFLTFFASLIRNVSAFPISVVFANFSDFCKSCMASVLLFSMVAMPTFAHSIRPPPPPPSFRYGTMDCRSFRQLYP